MARPQYGYRNAAGRKVPGVTTVLKNVQTMDGDILCSWAAKLARAGQDWRQVRSAAGDHGTMLHELCETKLPHALADGDRPAAATDEAWEKLKLTYAAVRAWWLRETPVIISAEEALVSERYQFGGTYDALVEWRGQPWLLDYKTGSQVGAKEVAQMAAYREMLDECKGVRPVGAVLVHAPTKEPGYVRPVVLPTEALDAGWRLFLAGLEVGEVISVVTPYCE